MSEQPKDLIASQILFNPHAEPLEERLATLKQLYPECFDKNGDFLVEKFSELLKTQHVEINKEYYQLNWLGKAYAKLLRNLPPNTLLIENEEHNNLPQNKDSQNLLIKGDNLEVLKHLKYAYKGAIKMIYIDPPYNTGSDGFVYQDDRKFNAAQLAELGGMEIDEAQRVLDFTAKKSNSHSAWLTFMYPRLYIARELLKDDGVIFISIDDNEQAQLKMLCDEVFGEENFVAGFIWNNKYTVSNDTDVSYQHENILCYARNRPQILLNLLERTKKNNKDYRNRDNDPKGAWKATPIHARSGTDSKIYTIKFPNGVLWTAPKGRYPRYSKKRLQELYDEGALYFNKNGGVDKKTYLSEVRNGITCGTLWCYEEVGHSHSNNEELADLLGKGVFSDPKGTALIKKSLKLSTSPNDLVLDFFAGSGTTGHAVMQLNAEDNGSRQFIMVQLPEETKETSEAHKAGYKTIFDITKARIEKVAEKIQAENPDYEGDLGFKIFETVEDFRAFQQLNTDNDVPQKEIDFPDLTHLSPEQVISLLTTWRVYDGQRLTEKVQIIDLSGYKAYLCNKHLYLLYPNFQSVQIKAILDKLDQEKDFVLERIILLGDVIESAKQMELKQAITTYSNRKSLSIHLLVRY